MLCWSCRRLLDYAMHCKELEVQEGTEGMEEEQQDAEFEQEVEQVEEQEELLGLSESACLAFELY